MKKKVNKDKPMNLSEEPVNGYPKHSVKIVGSHSELDNESMEKMALLNPVEILQQLRQLINLAYGMHGYDPNNLPKKHTIKIIKKG